MLPSTVKLLTDEQIKSLGITSMGDIATLKDMCGRSVRSKYAAYIYLSTLATSIAVVATYT